MRKFSLRELALYNGQDREQVYIAYKGIVYDVTHSRLWHTGRHYAHWAGQDLTAELEEAPHTAAVFERFPAVGILT